MPDEVVTLKVTLDAAKDIESRLRTMDSLMDSLRKNSNVKLTVDTSSFDKLINETKKYLSSVTEQVNQKFGLATTSQEILLAEKTLATEAAGWQPHMKRQRRKLAVWDRQLGKLRPPPFSIRLTT